MLSDPDFRELASLPVNAVLLQGLSRAGYTCVAEVASLSAERLAAVTGVTMDVARSGLNTIRGYHNFAMDCTNSSKSGFFRLQTAWDLLDKSRWNNYSNLDTPNETDSIVTMCRSFDELMGGGFPTGRLTELCGEPGVGKTQFCIQVCLTVQLPSWFGGLSGEAVFLDTEGNFMPRRAKQMAEALSEHCRRHFIPTKSLEMDEQTQRDQFCPSVESLMSGIHYMRLTDHIQLLSVCRRLEQFCSDHPKVRLIVVDSIALPFRYDFDDIAQRNRLLASVAQMLLCVAGQQRAAVILTNQITTRFDPQIPNSNSTTNPIPDNRSSRLVPALGDSWGHICSVRVFLNRVTSDFRQIQLLKHPGQPCGQGSYQVTVLLTADYCYPEHLRMESECVRIRETYLEQLSGRGQIESFVLVIFNHEPEIETCEPSTVPL